MRFERTTSRLSAGCTSSYATGPLLLPKLIVFSGFYRLCILVNLGISLCYHFDYCGIIFRRRCYNRLVQKLGLSENNQIKFPYYNINVKAYVNKIYAWKRGDRSCLHRSEP